MRKIIELGFFGIISTVLAVTSEDTLQAKVRKISVAIVFYLPFWYQSGKARFKNKSKSRERFQVHSY